MDSKDRKKFQEAKAEIIKRAHKDPSFKKKFKTHPHEVFKEYGFDLPKKIKVHVYENTPTTLHFVIPPDAENLKNVSVAGLLCKRCA